MEMPAGGDRKRQTLSCFCHCEGAGYAGVSPAPILNLFSFGINWLLPQLSTLNGRYLSALIIDSPLIESRSAIIARSGTTIPLSKLSLEFQSQVHSFIHFIPAYLVIVHNSG